ncbi:hypothetical protein ACLOJK_014133 [Asimina triloba]
MSVILLSSSIFPLKPSINFPFKPLKSDFGSFGCGRSQSQRISAASEVLEDGFVVVDDDLHALLQIKAITPSLRLPEKLAYNGSPAECDVASNSFLACTCRTEYASGNIFLEFQGVTGSIFEQNTIRMLVNVCGDPHLSTVKSRRRMAVNSADVIMDLGRFPEARFLGESGGQYLRNKEVSMKELEYAQKAVGEFGGDNRAGIEGTLHRISAIRSRKGMIVGLTCRVGRAVTGHVDMVRDLLDYGESILFLGRPGVGKTTVMREIARVLADELHRRVVIVDTSNEIGGDGDIPHSAIGGARRMQVPKPSMQHKVMIEAVENHMPEVVIVDEIGTEAEAVACRSIAERGVMLIGTAHGERLENIIKNPTLSDLVGGVETVTLGDDEARARRCQKSILERKAPPTFPFLIEMRDRKYWVTHWTERSVDMLLHGKKPFVEVRKRDDKFKVVIERWKAYDGDGV